MTSKNTPTNAESIALDEKNIDGVKKYFSALPQLTLAGLTTTPPEVEAVFQADIDASKTLDASESDVKDKRAAQKAARKAATAMRRRLKKYIIGNYGEQAVKMLEDCGFEAPKARKQTVKSKAHAQDQAKATRDARGTKGRKQRLDIKGVVPAKGDNGTGSGNGGGAGGK